MYGAPSEVPGDKMMRLFIIQSISAFVANDYETGIHFLKEIKQAYAEYMSQLNPTLKNLAKEIIQSVDLFKPDGTAFMGGAFAPSEDLAPTPDMQPQMPSFDEQPSAGETSQQPVQEQAEGEQPRSVAAELQDLLNRRRARRRK